MAARALIICIENYPRAAGGMLAAKLPGTLAAGKRFRQWLIKKWKHDGRPLEETQIFFCSAPKVSGGRGAGLDEIVTTLREMARTGRGTTEELFVYFSGHGFATEGVPGERSDVLVGADFNPDGSRGASCLKFGELIDWLRKHMGVGHHYYFVDACRNVVSSRDIVVGNRLEFDPQDTQEATTYVLQSTLPGAPALVAGPFARTLLLGLQGFGKAKVWVPPAIDRMLVRYDSLRKFLKDTLSEQQPISHQVAGEDGESDAILAHVMPVPRYRLKVSIEKAGLRAGARLFVRRGTSKPDEHPLTQSPYTLELEPDFYALRLACGTGLVSPPGEVSVELFDHQQVEFSFRTATASLEVMSDSTPAGTALPGPARVRPPKPPSKNRTQPPAVPPARLARVSVAVPAGTRVMLRHMTTGVRAEYDTSQVAKLPSGTYTLALKTTDGATLKRRELEVVGGKKAAINFHSWGDSLPHNSIARRLTVNDAGVEFAPELGEPVKDPDLNLWLALLGGARMIGMGKSSPLAGFPLPDFSAGARGNSPLYVLAGFGRGDSVLKVAVSRDTAVEWQDAAEPDGMAGLRQAVFSPSPGPLLVSFQIGDLAPVTLSSLSSANRGTLVVLTLDKDGVPRFSQFLLPLRRFRRRLPKRVRLNLAGRNQYRDLLTLAQAGRAFRQRRRLDRELAHSRLDDLLVGKWLDPIGALLASYELIRRGRASELLPEVIDNLTTCFPDLPDTAALARLAGCRDVPVQGVPLFLDGLQALPALMHDLPLPAANLDFDNLWTSWQAAVPSAV